MAAFKAQPTPQLSQGGAYHTVGSRQVQGASDMVRCAKSSNRILRIHAIFSRNGAAAVDMSARDANIRAGRAPATKLPGKRPAHRDSVVTPDEPPRSNPYRRTARLPAVSSDRLAGIRRGDAGELALERGGEPTPRVAMSQIDGTATANGFAVDVAAITRRCDQPARAAVVLISRGRMIAATIESRHSAAKARSIMVKPPRSYSHATRPTETPAAVKPTK